VNVTMLAVRTCGRQYRDLSLGKRSRRGPLIFLQRREQPIARRAGTRVCLARLRPEGGAMRAIAVRATRALGQVRSLSQHWMSGSLIGSIATITPSGCFT